MNKNDCFKTKHIKINDDEIRNIINTVVQDVIANRAAKTTILLDNHDANLRPAAWWRGKEWHWPTTRCTLPASVATMSYDKATKTLKVHYTLPITEIPPPKNS